MKKKILIVEDEVFIAKALEMDFEDKGFDVIGISSDFNDTISMIKESKPDIVITDVNLRSTKDGIDIAKWINNFDCDTSVIFMTGYNDDVLSNRIKEVQHLGILQKPLNMNDVMYIVEQKSK
jgi:DNA-binding NtrC family response regulator